MYEFRPQPRNFIDHGDPVAALRAAGLYRDGEMQAKIHSHIQQADDGYVYFASMDETGESWRQQRLPQWGSHLWRIDPASGAWEHVLSAPEGLIAVNAVGRYVYALGYWDHVVHQYDTRTGVQRSVIVGSACGHVSRNFLADLRGHVYVPRVTLTGETGEGCQAAKVTATLVELSPKLDVVAEHALVGYLGKRKPAANHGITAYSFRLDESLVFVTDGGEFYHLIVTGGHPALIMRLGSIYPGERLKVSTLFSIDGKNLVATVGRLNKRLHWIRHDMGMIEATAMPLDLPPHRALLLYGSMVRDRTGGFYVGGRLQAPDGPLRPILLRLREASD